MRWMAGWLEAFGWHGKEFGRHPDDVQPLLFGHAGGGITAIVQATVPLGIVKNFGFLKRSRLARGAFRLGKRPVAARKPTARLRMMEYRSVVNAAILYDALSIYDILRQVSRRAARRERRRTNTSAAASMEKQRRF